MEIKRQFIKVVAVLAFAASCAGQGTNFQFISTSANKDRTVTIKWKSESNALYRIDYASVLVNSNTAWSTLYDRYPSHGTNTFWTDVGDYAVAPPIKRPQDSPKRFYRVAKIGTNTAPAPFVTISSPANGATVSGDLTISVTATSALPVLDIALFVDGQEMPSSDDGTNFVINTSEWPNGSHVLFATARAASALTGVPNQTGVTYGWKVSPYRNVTFSNYVSELSFSEPFFEPSLGQTQRVTAVFSANSSWTLQVLDVSDNPVRTATGTGKTMTFAWDGKGNGGASIPDGVYFYQVSATQTSGGAAAPGGGSGGGGSPPSPGMAAMAAGQTSYFIRPPPLPPVKQGGKWYAWEDLFGPQPPIEIRIPEEELETFNKSISPTKSSVMLAGGTGAAMAAAASTTKAPKRPPISPGKGVVSIFGIAYWTFPGGRTNQPPPNGLPGGTVSLDGQAGGAWIASPVPDFALAAQGFSKVMTDKRWKMGFHKSDNNLTKNELIRNDLAGYSGSNLFNRVNLGLFMSHGNFGTTLDFSPAAGQSKQTYFPAGGNNPPNSWIRLSDFRFGDNLRWMAILACNSLQEDAYQTMYNKMVLPIGDENQAWSNQLHLLMGCRTYAAVSAQMGERWAKKMTGGAFSSAQTIAEAWYSTGRETYQGQRRFGIFTNDLYFKVVGWDTTMGDRLNLYTIPDPSADLLGDDNRKVYP